MRSIWHLLFLLAVRTGRFRCMVQDCAAVMRALGEELGRMLGAMIEHLAVDLAHWLPNMPRGSEQI
jgi:hypothetical protein